MEAKGVLLLFPFCKLVKGYKRSAIYDLEMTRLHLISNGVYSFISESNGKTMEQIHSLFKETDKEILNSLVTSLLSKRIIRFVKEEDFPRFSPMRDFPQPESLIDHVVVDIDFDSNYNVSESLRKIGDFPLTVIQLRFMFPIDYNQLVCIAGEVYATGCDSIEMVVPYKTIDGIEPPNHLFDQYQNITNMYIYDAPMDKVEDYKQCQIVFMKKSVDCHDTCGIISQNSFICNKRFYIDAQSQNTCLSKKCAIDKNGIIKNCPYMLRGFGHIDDASAEQLHQIVASAEFTGLFSIKKDDIEACNVCEFRYACFDCRAFVSESGNFLSKPAKCSYDPYIASWNNK